MRNYRSGFLGFLFAAAMVCDAAYGQPTYGKIVEDIYNPAGRFYVGINVGASFLQGADNTPNDQSLFPVDRQTEYQTGNSIGGFVGYHLSNTLRLEAEFNHQENDFEELGDFTEDTHPDVFIGRDFFFYPVAFVEFPSIETTSLMANVYKDFDVGWPVIPFIGVGVGATSFDINDAVMVDDNDTVLTGQLRIGASYPVSESAAVTFNYRLFVTDQPRFADDIGNRFKTEHLGHGLEVGFRYTF